MNEAIEVLADQVEEENVVSFHVLFVFTFCSTFSLRLLCLLNHLLKKNHLSEILNWDS